MIRVSVRWGRGTVYIFLLVDQYAVDRQMAIFVQSTMTGSNVFRQFYKLHIAMWHYGTAKGSVNTKGVAKDAVS